MRNFTSRVVLRQSARLREAQPSRMAAMMFAILFVLAGFGIKAQAAPGDVDTTFGTGGRVTTNFANVLGDDEARALVLQADGKLVAAGGGRTEPNGNAHFALVRYVGDPPVVRRPPADFDGDGRSDLAVFRPSNGTWYIQQSTAGFRAEQFGLGTDLPVAADYDGDGKADVAVYRDGTWFILKSSDGTMSVSQFGLSSDWPVAADYDGDGKADLAVTRTGPEASSPVFFYILQSSDGAVRAEQWGTTGTDVPVVADYDGDGRADVAVFRHAGGVWFILQSSNGAVRSEQFGLGNFADRPLSADFDGDGRSDLAVFRQSEGTWYILQSMAGFRAQQFGLGSDIPMRRDYDGDGKADLAVFRPSNGTWFILQSSNGSFIAQGFGLNGDVPVP